MCTVHVLYRITMISLSTDQNLVNLLQCNCVACILKVSKFIHPVPAGLATFNILYVLEAIATEGLSLEN